MISSALLLKVRRTYDLMWCEPGNIGDSWTTSIRKIVDSTLPNSTADERDFLVAQLNDTMAYYSRRVISYVLGFIFEEENGK